MGKPCNSHVLLLMASRLSRHCQVVGQDAFAMQCRQQGGQQAFLSILGMGEQKVEVSAGFSAASERTTGCHLHAAHQTFSLFLHKGCKLRSFFSSHPAVQVRVVAKSNLLLASQTSTFEVVQASESPVPPGLSSLWPRAPDIRKEGEHFHFLTAADLLHLPDPAVLHHLHDLVRQGLPYPWQGHRLLPDDHS